MRSAPMTFIATNDLAAQTRGRSVPAEEAEAALTGGVGWVPANLAITAFGAIAEDNVFGAAGDLRLIPDASTFVEIPPNDRRPGLRVMLADQKLPDGSDWGCCPRTFARTALEEFTEVTGLEVVASFEHEFVLPDSAPSAPFSLQRFREAEPFGSELIALLDQVGLEPETWLPEYGENQFEVTLKPAPGIMAADRAVLLRELVRDLASLHGRRASFAPLQDPDGSGNGVHIHISLRDASTGVPVLYDASEPAGLGLTGQKFAAGIIRHAAALNALTACGPSSAMRLRPHRWSVGGIFLGDHHREALLRICPTSTAGGGQTARQFNLEFRAADATANPWIALGALVRAGLEGIRRDVPPVCIYPEDVSDKELSEVPMLPANVDESLECFTADPVVQGWFHADLSRTLTDVKRAETSAVEGLSPQEICRWVADVY